MDHELRLAELLASRLCHDLIGPVSAINNGLELMAEDMGMEEEAQGLMAESAAQASHTLQFFRLAHGTGGGQEPALSQVRELARQFLSHGKCALAWPELEPGRVPEGSGKLLLNLLVLAREALPRGGQVSVTLLEGAEGFQISASAVGADAGLRDEVWRALEPSQGIEGLTARSVQGFFTRRVVERMGGSFLVRQEAPDQIVVTASVPG